MSLRSILAMTMLMTGGKMPKMFYDEPKKAYIKLTPEEQEVELQRQKEKFVLNLNKHNEERRLNFPKWKEFDVNGFMIIASNEKNAHRDLSFLINRNLV